jgi:hypothetical protein
MDTVLETRLREMLDREEIRQVLLRYGRGLDRLDVDLVRSCYFDDAIEDHGRFVGSPDAFIAWANGTMGAIFQSIQHHITNHVCDLQGDDAWCETYYIFTGIAATAPHFMSTGRYVDHLQRRNGEWRFANRITIVEGTFDIPDAVATAALPPAYTPEEPCQATRDRTDISYHRPPVPRRPAA